MRRLPVLLALPAVAVVLAGCSLPNGGKGLNEPDPSASAVKTVRTPEVGPTTVPSVIPLTGPTGGVPGVVPTTYPAPGTGK